MTRSLKLVFTLLALSTGLAVADPPAAKPGDVGSTASQTAKDEASDRPCIRDTGSRIPSKRKDGCNDQPGRSYDHDDLDRTGATNAADALRLLDSGVTTRR